MTGLTVGHTYDLDFDWGATQQTGYSGATTSKWQVSIGGSTFNTAVYNLPNHGFSGWMHQTFSYTATASSALLSFLAVGTPSGLPPFALLDSVTMVDTTPAPMPAPVPEPEMAVSMLAGLLVVAVARRRKRIA